jgi:hypothetical protein
MKVGDVVHIYVDGKKEILAYRSLYWRVMEIDSKGRVLRAVKLGSGATCGGRGIKEVLHPKAWSLPLVGHPIGRFYRKLSYKKKPKKMVPSQGLAP